MAPNIVAPPSAAAARAAATVVAALLAVVVAVSGWSFAAGGECRSAGDTRLLDFENPLPDDGTIDVSGGTVTPVGINVYLGVRAGEFGVAPSGPVSFARVTSEVLWSEGDEVWFGAALFLPVGTVASLSGHLEVIRWDNYAEGASGVDQTGVAVTQEGRLVLVGERAGRQSSQVVVDAGPVDEGRWAWVEVHQILGTEIGEALSQVFVDGFLVASSTAANLGDRPVSRLRYGIVSLPETQSSPLSLRLDSASAGTCQSGPRGW